MKQALPSFFHLDQTTLESLPQLVVGGTPHVTRVPDVMLDELFNLMLPLRFKHNFLDRLHCDHQSVHIFNEDVISCNKKFFAACLATTSHRLKICRGREHLPAVIGRRSARCTVDIVVRAARVRARVALTPTGLLLTSDLVARLS